MTMQPVSIPTIFYHYFRVYSVDCIQKPCQVINLYLLGLCKCSVLCSHKIAQQHISWSILATKWYMTVHAWSHRYFKAQFLQPWFNLILGSKGKESASEKSSSKVYTKVQGFLSFPCPRCTRVKSFKRWLELRALVSWMDETTDGCIL
jgi:hypothetical protein